MGAPLKISATVTIDPSQAKVGAKETQVAVAGIGMAADDASTKLQRLIETSFGIGGSAANNNIREWSGALAMAGRSADELRAKYNPLFAVISQYKQNLVEIRTLTAQGVLTTDEMTAAIQRQRQTTLASIDAIKGTSTARAEVERLRASYDSVYAAEAKHKQILAEINRAEQIGALSPSGAADARLKQVAEYNKALEGIASGPARQLDELRAKYNPLFAVISQYKQNLVEIRNAQAVGAISTDEMTSAIQRQRQATLASIDAIKGRNSAMRTGGGGGSNFAATNVMFQAQDVVTTALMGMDPRMIGLQQGSQLAGGFAGMSAKEVLSTLGAGITSLISPVSIATVGLTAATAAAIQFGVSLSQTETKTEKLDDVLQTHADLLKKLEERYGALIDKAKGYGAESSRILAVSASADLRSLSRVSNTEGLNFFNEVGVIRNNVRGGGDFSVDSKYSAFADALKKLREEAKAGRPDFESFYDTIGRIAEADPQFGKQADELAKLVTQYRDARKALEELKRIREALFNDRGPNGLLLSQGTSAQADQNAGGLFEIQQAQQAKRTAASFAAQLQELQARTIAEKVAAARATAAAQNDNSEKPEARRTRIDNAGILAQKQAEKELADAKRDRLRSIDDTLTSSRQELTLIGQTTSSMEAQRMELRLLTEANNAAEKAGTVVSDDEKQRIKEAAAEYGRLAEAIKATNVLRDQSRNLEQLRLEISLVGQSEATRQRALAIAEAENTIREQGISATGRQAQQIRANASAMAEETLKLNRLQDAWNNVQSAGEDAIDAIGEALRTGDWSKALDSVVADIQKSAIQLGITNPLKNAFLGTNYGTATDAGGLLSKLFGGGSVSPLTTSSVGAMNVTAASVVINGGVSAGGLLGGIGSAANDNLSGIGGAATTNKSGVAAQIWNFFAGKGLKDFQIAGILGNVSRESSFNPTAVGDGGNALGLMQWNDRSPSLLSAIGGRGNLSNVQAQLDFAWKELQTSENGVLQRLLKSTNVQDATAAFAGFERPRGWSLANPQGADGWSARLSGATEALTKFGSTTNSMSGVVGTATQNLGTFSNGLGGLGNSLQSAANGVSGGGGGGIGSWLSKLFGIGSSFVANGAQATLAASGSIFGLFDSGGYTGDGARLAPAGVVHKGEVVWNQDDVARAGGWQTVEAMRLGRRGYATGGVAGGGTLPAANDGSSGKSSIVINNYSSAKVTAEETQDDKGQRQTVFTIADAVGDALSKKGGGAKKTLASDFGIRQRGRRR